MTSIASLFEPLVLVNQFRSDYIVRCMIAAGQDPSDLIDRIEEHNDQCHRIEWMVFIAESECHVDVRERNRRRRNGLPAVHPCS